MPSRGVVKFFIQFRSDEITVGGSNLTNHGSDAGVLKRFIMDVDLVASDTCVGGMVPFDQDARFFKPRNPNVGNVGQVNSGIGDAFVCGFG